MLRASILVAERRWNLRLKNGLDVRLPETNVAQALERLVALDREKKLLSRDITAVDLRLPDRVTVRLSDAAAQAREDALKRQEEEKGRRRMSSLHYGLTPKMKPIPPRRSALVAALDVGSSKIACLIARLRPHPPQQVLTRRTHAVEVIGYGHAGARGTKAGAVVNLAQAEQAIRQAVDGAERMASVEIEIGHAFGRRPGGWRANLFAAEIDIDGSAVSEGDIARVLAAGNRQSLREGRAVLHSLPIGYSIDGGNGIRDPARHARLALRRRHACGDDRHRRGAQSDAGGRALPSFGRGDGRQPLCRRPFRACRRRSRSRRRGGRYGRGHDHHRGVRRRPLRSSEGFALGGHNVTMDIARGINASIADAERIKTFYGSVLVGGSDERDMITVPPIGDRRARPSAIRVPRAALVHIIKPRVEEILEMVRDRLAASSFAAEPRGRVILTGGASQITGLPELAARILGRPVRIGRPLGIAGLPEAAKGAAFAVATGLLVYPQAAHLEHFETRGKRYLRTWHGRRLFRPRRTMASRGLLMAPRRQANNQPKALRLKTAGQRRTGRSRALTTPAHEKKRQS